jgi:anti-sigma factor RsiW
VSQGLPPPWSPPPLSCDGFRARVHARADLPPLERRAFDRHATECRACGRVLLECERLDDLLLHWVAPEPSGAPAGDEAGDSFDERVLKALRGEGPTAGCAESTASLHHFVAGDLEPWLAARVERHLMRCASCRDHLDEVNHSRKVWLAWRAPEPAEGFADQIVRRLEPATRSARRRRQVAELLLGAIPVPRIAAGLVLTSLTLLAFGVVRARLEVTTPPQHDQQHDQQVVQSRRDGPPSDPPPVSRGVDYVPTPYVPQAGSSDPTDSFSPVFHAGERGTLRHALRGEPLDR